MLWLPSPLSLVRWSLNFNWISVNSDYPGMAQRPEASPTLSSLGDILCLRPGPGHFLWSRVRASHWLMASLSPLWLADHNRPYFFLAKSEARSRSHSAMINLIKVEHDKIKAVLPSLARKWKLGSDDNVMIWIAKNWLHEIAHFRKATIICDWWTSDIKSLVSSFYSHYISSRNLIKISGEKPKL